MDTFFADSSQIHPGKILSFRDAMNDESLQGNLIFFLVNEPTEKRERIDHGSRECLPTSTCKLVAISHQMHQQRVNGVFLDIILR